ncbi:unnamed protein product [Clonostachys rosea]|uniref:Uncharacterized protein n=1 Tax=Bionectria ochroleuca TaxID=29856 RepID=A0ABY6V113_BIOOC|nr:unnamed protein product [Clonostachys rosea]
MESLQLSQVLADLSNINAAEAETATAIVNANTTLHRPEPRLSTASAPPEDLRPSVLRRALSAEGPVDRFGRRIIPGSTGSRSGSATNSVPGTPRRGDVDQLDDDLERASTLMALYDIRAKLKQQDNSSLLKAREKINALAAKQQAQQNNERNSKTSDQLRRNRYSFPKPGL